MHHGATKWSCLTVLAAMISIWALVSPAQAVTYNLQANEFTKTMPDGRVVTMWGYYNPADPRPIELQFPLVLDVPPGDNTLEINLTNNLGEFTSLMLNGFRDSAMVPVALPGSNPTRYRSLTHETAAGEQNHIYTWNLTNRSGTFLLQSGSHLSVQVPMGLYATVKKAEAVGTPSFAYPNIPYDTEVTFLFSEVDPDLNAAVAGDPMVPGSVPTFGTPAFPSAIRFVPKYFLVNGDPFPFGNTHTYVGPAGSRVLMRFLNAGLLMRSPVVLGEHMTVVAEDGNPYPSAKTQYSLDLAAGKTLDAIMTTATDLVSGYFSVFDRRLGLTNADTSTGGMLTYLEVGPSHDIQAILNVTKTSVGGGTGTVESISLPGGIACGLICSQHYLPGTELRLTAVPDPGSVFAGWTVEGGWTEFSLLAGTSDLLVTLPTDVATTPSVTVSASFARANTRVGVFQAGQWYLDKGDPGWQSLTIDQHIPNFGNPGDIPVAGDMNGDGLSEVGVFVPSTGQWYFDLDNNGSWSECLNQGGADLCLAQFGAPGHIPVTGDWDGDGLDEVGTFFEGMWFFDMDGSGTWDPDQDAFRLNFGAAGNIPVTGDWNGDGKTEIGTYNQGMWFLDNGNGRWDDPNDPTVTNPDTVYQNFGASGHLPVTGDWNNDGKTEVGTYWQGMWFQDFNGNGGWDGLLGGDTVIDNFGSPTDRPVTGVWR